MITNKHLSLKMNNELRTELYNAGFKDGTIVSRWLWFICGVGTSAAIGVTIFFLL